MTALDADNATPRNGHTDLPLIGPLLCLGCIIERHQGTRTEPNPAVTIVGGQATCLDHLQIADGPALPGRTPGGIILGGG